MNKLMVNDEGFVDLRRNPPATRVQVQGGTAAPEPPSQPVPVLPEPPRLTPPPAPAPIQRSAEGLAVPAAPPVAVKAAKRPLVLKRIDSVDGPPCYAIVGAKQFERLGRYEWHGTRGGKLYRKVVSATGVVTIIWLHRAAANCNRIDRFVAFLDGDERNCHFSNLKICRTKEEARAIRRDILGKAANGSG